MKYRDPNCYIADIEDMTGKSYRTARRIMGRIRNHFGLTARQKPTLDQVKSYLVSTQ